MRWISAVTLCLTAPALAFAAPQTPPPQTPPPKPVEAPMPLDLDKIQREAQIDPVLKLDDGQKRYYVHVVARMPTFLELVGKNTDLINGPTPYGGMTFREFVKMNTPQALHSTVSGITPRDMLQLAVTNWAGQWALKKLLEQLRDAKNEDEIRLIRSRIDRELAALKGGG
jgi:hypothetical protein